MLLRKDSGRPQRVDGFTLVEILVILAILGVLASIAIPVYSHYVDKARTTVAISTLDTLRKDFESYYIDYQGYPPQPIDFTTGIDGAFQTALSGGLLNQINNDLTIVSYNTTTHNTSYTLIAKAKDKDQTVLTLTPTEVSKAL